MLLNFVKPLKKSMKITPFLLLIIITLLFSSCAKLPVYESKIYVPSEKENLLNPLTSNYDKKTNIQIGIANNDSILYIQAIFHDKQSYKKIMRGGLTVFFDPLGKKKKNYQLKIEKTEVQLTEYELMTRQRNNNLNNPQQNMPSTIDMMYNKVTWDKNGDKFVFYRNLQNKPIGVKLGANKQNELLLEIEIPLKEIPLETGQNLFSIGIESSSVESGNMSGQRPSAEMSSGGSRSGGGGRGGGGGGGMSGGKSGGSRPAGSSSEMESIKIWFQVEL